MASAEQIAETYDYMDRLFRLSFGDHADFSCAFFDGDFSMTLAQAQKAKHDYIFEHLNLRPGCRVFDIGCGWGPVLQMVARRGGHAVGVTLSPRQARTCSKGGFEVYLQDWREIDASRLGTFDGVTSLGAFEHFCSLKDYREGRQEQIYSDFFALASASLPDHGRLFLQTMIWGESAPTADEVSLDADEDSNGQIVAVLRKYYPGSWLPESLDQIIRTASPYFRLVSTNNGRKDYLETNARWAKELRRPSLAKLLAVLNLVPKYLTSRKFRYKVQSMTTRGGHNRECLARKIIDHERIVFEKI